MVGLSYPSPRSPYLALESGACQYPPPLLTALAGAPAQRATQQEGSRARRPGSLAPEEETRGRLGPADPQDEGRPGYPGRLGPTLRAPAFDGEWHSCTRSLGTSAAAALRRPRRPASAPHRCPHRPSCTGCKHRPTRPGSEPSPSSRSNQRPGCAPNRGLYVPSIGLHPLRLADAHTGGNARPSGYRFRAPPVSGG